MAAPRYAPLVDIRELQGQITRDDWPRVLCPTCRRALLELDQSSITHAQDPETLRDRQNGIGEQGPDYRGEEEGVFTALLICTSSRCRQPVSVVGNWGLFYVEDERGHVGFGELLQPKMFYPPLVIVGTSAKVPASVTLAIEQASSVLWVSPGAAANRLRQGVEALLTAKGIRRFRRNKKPEMLEARLDLFHKKEPQVVEALRAVKWIGNVGSHDATVSIDDVLAGAEILDHALRTLYDTRDAKLVKKARLIVKSRGRNIPN